MKKLYAKTSFASKKSNKNVKEIVEADMSSHEETFTNAYQSAMPPHPVAAGQIQKPDNKRKSSLYIYKQPFATASYTSEETVEAYLPQVMQQQQHSDESNYYYSIADLENFNMIDHRHPFFQRQLRERTQHRQQQQQQYHHITPTFHQHHKLVLQIPLAHVAATPTSSSPIYEAPPQIINNTVPDMDTVALSSSLPAAVAAAASADDDEADVDSVNFGSLPNVKVLHRHAKISASRSTITAATLRNSAAASVIPSPSSFPLQHTNSMPSIRTCSFNFMNPTSTNSAVAAAHNALVDQLRHNYHQHQLLPQRHNSVKEKSISGTTFAEQSIIGARASVMVYDDNQKKWIPSGSSSGLSRVQIYHHQQNNTFRVVGRKLHDHEVVINCSILKGLKYNQATATFHQWRDSKYVYGLNFSTQQDAEAFARAMMHALEVLSSRVANNPGQPTSGNGYEEDMGYRTMTSEDAAILRQQQQITGQVTPSAQTPTSQTNQNNIPQSPPTPQGHHRTSRNSLSAPPAPQPQPMSTMPQPQPQQQQQQQQQQLYGQTGNGPTQNGMQQQQPQTQAQQTQIPPAPGQTQYHAPQVMQQQSQQQQQPIPVYSSQQLMNPGYQQQQTQYPPNHHYVLSNSNPNLNLHQYSQQPGVPGVAQPPMPPPHQSQNGVVGGAPIYVSSQLPQGIPSSASSNSVVYASQQQMGGGVPLPPQPTTLQNGGPTGLPTAYGQLNGAPNQQESSYGQVPMAPPMMPPVSSNGAVGGIPMPPPLNRMSSSGQVPVAPPPPPAFGGAPQMLNSNSANAPPPPQPPAPPAPPVLGGGVGAPPPPPPPPMGGLAAKKDDPQAELMGSLAAQLQQAKLKKNKSALPPTENSGSSTSSGGSGNYGTIGRSTSGMASMMDEMAKTLARRRAQAEKKEPEPDPDVKQRPWEKSNTLPHKLGGSSGSSNCNANSSNTANSGNESPRPMRKRFGSASEETILKQVNGDSLSLALSGSDLDTLKAEIVREMRLEIQKVKQEIIDAIKSEFNRR